ncbi:Lrp/AsnC family transcriptional regulator [Kineosporia corallincola]|uniref:Lrp/AsnC family transcriptional regulator n=1 Tax=Kineosporia corallincola TaxID=2835133 RepID=UPI0027E17762|nr:Lrp/AsnC family transcriptional regulator [Kineosporia corallincola]
MPASLDGIDRDILRVLDRHPRATTQYIAQDLKLARGTVLAHLRRLTESGLLAPATSRLDGAVVGKPLRVFVRAEVDQNRFDGLVEDLERVPEIIECSAVSGGSDLLIELVAADPDDVYRVTQRIMRCRGIRRTDSSFVLRQVIPRRMEQLL